MASRKSERLINLTMALLATRRYLTKSEIFRTVDGYSGSEESKERMFERDKDDLRSIGIAIDVRSLDPLFEDEPGYRIHPDSYSLDMGELSGVEVALLSLAAQAWRGAALGASAQSAFVKLRSLGVDSDFDAIPALSPRLTVDSANFVPISQAVSDRSLLHFSYLSAELIVEEREVEPYGLGSRQGLWYLVGRDLTRNAMRTFRLARILGEVSAGSGYGAFEVPESFDVLNFLDENLSVNLATTTLFIRIGKGHVLRRSAEVLSSDGEFDRCAVTYRNETELISQILWHGDDVIVESPPSIREVVLSQLAELIDLHE